MNSITHIYAWPLEFILILMFLGVLIWFLILKQIGQRTQKILGAVMTAFSFFIILKFTVLGREGTHAHEWVFAVPDSPEFIREMLMNAFLYFPLGLGLSCLLGKKAIPAAFCLSFGIEVWQFFSGAGMAQGTDIIMNTLGAAIGWLPWMLNTRKRTT